jgi:hypothetical protein
MTQFKEALIFLAEGADPADRTYRETALTRTAVVPVPDAETVAAVAAELGDDGVRSGGDRSGRRASACGCRGVRLRVPARGGVVPRALRAGGRRLAMKVPRSTSETQAPAAAASEGFVTYDELGGPDLDAARWSPARLPLPTASASRPTPTRSGPSASSRPKAGDRTHPAQLGRDLRLGRVPNGAHRVGGSRGAAQPARQVVATAVIQTMASPFHRQPGMNGRRGPRSPTRMKSLWQGARAAGRCLAPATHSRLGGRRRVRGE